jgi:hypothetical protein
VRHHDWPLPGGAPEPRDVEARLRDVLAAATAAGAAPPPPPAAAAAAAGG